MSNKMLIDASHPEETRVVVTKGNRIEEFDFESEHKKQLKGNIYLARVTRVEPSLQAAFVEYGGNRHGFLAFSEIHPDYYQIPLADRQALLDAEHLAADDEAEHSAEEEKSSARKKNRGRRGKNMRADAAHTGDSVSEAAGDEPDDEEEEKPVDLVGAEDALEELPTRLPRARGASWRDYKIQEIIKRRQILLVQIVKEERGNKGAALTTYLSLAGRYSVLMPNTPRGGGISRKITNLPDRKRLKEIVKGLAVPRGMGIILRTAGAARTKTEVRRDYEYLMRLWENVRSLTLTSMAPALVYEEGSLIKRSIRDLYNKDIDEVLVAGEKSYREAKDFMRMLMPSHAKFVQPYRDPAPIFARRGIEAQLDGMLQPEVSLKSGGYLVINQTEALVAIDVNSGRSTREHSVEETALQTNLEAAEEVARQLRLRDLAGLVVIDFIDMQEKRNIRAVEKKLKDCLRDDRARIQLGRISHFGLMEMSRQRIRASVLESTTKPCPHCFGTGYVRSQSSLALHVLRVVEEYLQRSASHNIMVRTPVSTALYVLNQKRRALTELEERFGLTIDIEADNTIGKEHLAIHKTSEAQPKAEITEGQQPVSPVPADADWDKTEADEAETETKSEAAHSEERHERDNRRRHGRDKAKAERSSENHALPPEQKTKEAAGEDEPKRRRRRGRRGGKRNRELNGERHIPQAEPVGLLAAELKAEAKAKPAELLQSVLPAAEPVGIPAEHNNTPAEAAKSGRGDRGNHPLRNKRRAKAENTAIADNSASGAEVESLAPESAASEQKNGRSKQQNSRRRKNDSKASAAADTAKIASLDEISSETITGSAETEADAAKDQGKKRAKPAAGAEAALAEPVVTSSSGNAESENTGKKKGWWRGGSFF